MKKFGIKEIVATLVGLGSLIGMAIGADHYFAKQKTLEKTLVLIAGVEQRLDYNLRLIEIKKLQDKIAAYDAQFGPGCARCTPLIKQTYDDWVIQVQNFWRMQKGGS